jgi:hypothetical protein
MFKIKLYAKDASKELLTTYHRTTVRLDEELTSAD